MDKIGVINSRRSKDKSGSVRVKHLEGWGCKMLSLKT